MEIIQLKEFIAGVGFPIFVAVYLLVYLRRTLTKLTTTLADLTKAFQTLTDKVERINKGDV